MRASILYGLYSQAFLTAGPRCMALEQKRHAWNMWRAIGRTCAQSHSFRRKSRILHGIDTVRRQGRGRPQPMSSIFFETLFVGGAADLTWPRLSLAEPFQRVMCCRPRIGHRRHLCLARSDGPVVLCVVNRAPEVS